MPAMPEPTRARLDEAGNLILSERTIPLPRSISKPAQAWLSAPSPLGGGTGAPAPDLKSSIRATDAAYIKMMEPVMKTLPVSVETSEMAGVPVYVSAPNALPAANRNKVNLAIHGGGLIML